MTALLSVDARTATRSHAGAAYLAPALARANLLVLPGAHVTKVRRSKRASRRRLSGGYQAFVTVRKIRLVSARLSR